MTNEISCPTCNADIPLVGDEKSGESIFCTVCSAPLLLRGSASGNDVEAEEDF